MSVSGFLHRLVVGEQHCRVIIEVPDMRAEAWRRLTADPELSWRRVVVSRQLGVRAGIASVPRKRRVRGPVDLLTRVDTPVPALVEASGSATGSPAQAKRRVAAAALRALRGAGLRGDLVCASDAPWDSDPPLDSALERDRGNGRNSAWPAAGGVLVFGPAEQAELNRRFALAASIWSLPSDRARPPKVPEPGQRRRRAIVDLVAVLCVLPLLLMAVPTVGPWLDLRGWALLLAAAAVAVAVPVLVVQALIPRWPLLVGARARALGAAAGLLVLLVLARLLISVPLPPTVVLVVAAGVVAVLTPVALRLLPLDRPALIGLALLPVLLALLATPVGDLLDGVYLERLGLRPTDVALSFAQRWLSGAYFGVIALAGVALAAALWGAFYQLDAVGRRRAVPPAPVLALLGLVYAVALLALSAGAAGRQAGAGNDGLPGRWGGIAPVWVCWSAPPGGYVPYTGAERPPTGVTVAWLGGASSRFALWSGDTGGATVSDQVQLRIRPSAGPCG